MRVLKFAGTEQDKDMFRMLYQGFLLGAPEGGLKGIGPHRTALKLMDRLDAASQPVMGEDGKVEKYVTGDDLRDLDGEQTIVLDDAEYEMLKKHFNNVPWRVSVSRTVVATMDFLEAAPDSLD
jgi:hypothetical protein